MRTPSGGHETRASFPVDLARRPHAYQSHCLEAVYPGMHSDVGGGYGRYSSRTWEWRCHGEGGAEPLGRRRTHENDCRVSPWEAPR